MYRLLYTKQTLKDAKKLKKSNLKEKALQILNLRQTDPWKKPSPKRLIGDLEGAFSEESTYRTELAIVYLRKN